MMKLKVRGTVATVGSYDHCLDTLMKKWGWVPMRFAPLLQAELVQA